VRHWADGGETKLDNLVLLCRFHHRLVHEEGYRVHFPKRRANSADQKLYFLDPRMRLLPEAPQPPATRLGSATAMPSDSAPGTDKDTDSSTSVPRSAAPPPNPAEPLIQENRAHGIEPDFRTSSARYKRDDDIPSELILRALEALQDLEALGEGPDDSSRADAAA
jgi:hypothetical protein